MPLRSFAVISVKSALYCGLSAASELSQTPSRPLSGSMYQSVSSAACWSPLDCEPALIAQILNQPAFLIVPSGFSRISSSFLGMFCGMPCALELTDRKSCCARAHRISTSNARMRFIVFSLIAPCSFGHPLRNLDLGNPMNNINHDLYPKIGFTRRTGGVTGGLQWLKAAQLSASKVEDA